MGLLIKVRQVRAILVNVLTWFCHVGDLINMLECLPQRKTNRFENMESRKKTETVNSMSAPPTFLPATNVPVTF